MSAGQNTRRESMSDDVGRYRVGEQLAVGGMGTIYRAFDALARREVAYKRLRVTNESARPRLTALFEREYNELCRLKHPNIVEVYDYGLDAEGPYYTMELLAGKDLAAAAPLSIAEACRVVRDVASALALLHARRLVHRDVTPANVRLTQDGRAKLIDFGALTVFGTNRAIVGTPAFIAPECLEGEPLDGRTDLFALGGVAYWALTRRHAYGAHSIGELMRAWEIPVSPLSEHRSDVPKELDELVLSLLEREKLARPASAAHVMEKLTAIAQLGAEQDESHVAYSYLLHPPLIGRDVVLGQLRHFAAEMTAGRGRAVMIEAAPGLGRSALLDQVAVDAQLSGANVLRFQPNGGQKARLAQTVVQWMRASFPALWDEQRARFPALEGETRTLRAAQSPGDVTQERAKLVAALQACVEASSQLAPITILIDDVQRADAESLAVLASLARVASTSRILLVTTQHERAVGSDASALSDLRAMSTRLALRPLAERDVEHLVEAVFGDVPNSHRLARFLHAQSGGNPGQCMDFCRLLLQEKQIRYALGTFVLPFDPRGDVRGTKALELTRLAELSAPAVKLVRLLSVHDGALSARHAASVLSYDPEQVLRASEELAARGLVRVRDTELALASESLRLALSESVSEDERKPLHLELGRCILRDGDGAIETKLVACHHLLLAGREDEALQLVWDDLRSSTIPLGSTAASVPVLERLLAVQRARGRPDEHCWPLLAPLVVAGFWGELASVRRHRDAALTALANLTGIGLARRLAPRLGKKLALLVGIVYGVFRFLRTPKAFRAPSYGDLLQRFFSMVTMSTATASSAFEPEAALRIAGFLDPIEAMKEHTPGRVAREFALASAEVGAGLNQRSARRYASIMEKLDKYQLFDESTREGFRDGCIHGRAQAEVTSGSPNGLAMAEELARRHPFFGPHVESIKMTFHGYRGEKQLADEHRRRGEMLALQGGLSWSAFTVMSVRTAYIAMVSQDTMGVLRASVELERLSQIAPNLTIYRDLCQAYVSMVRGAPEAAIEIYERMEASPNARLRPAWELDRSFYAEALARVGKLHAAKSVCEEAIQSRNEQGISGYPLRIPIQQLALTEAKLGNVARAKHLLEELWPVVARSEAPLPIGALQRDLARIALIERDTASFDKHFEAMLAAFRKTNNPALIQQCRRLLAEAEKSGVVATPNWERHDLLEPANTQDLASQAPDVTELVETQ